MMACIYCLPHWGSGSGSGSGSSSSSSPVCKEICL